MKKIVLSLLFIISYSSNGMGQNRDVEEVFVGTEIECQGGVKGLFGDLLLSEADWKQKAAEYCNDKCDEAGLDAKIKQTSNNPAKYSMYRQQFKNQFCGVKAEVIENLKSRIVDTPEGSRARGDHQKFSDIDVMYELPINSKLTPEKIAKIKFDLEDSDLPYKVDLVNKEDLAPSYLINAMKDRVSF